MTLSAKHRLWWLQLMMLSLCLSASARARADAAPPLADFVPTMLQPTAAVATDDLRIEWSTSAKPAPTGIGAQSERILAAEICDRLGEALRVGRGLGGIGLFDDFGCYLSRRPPAEQAAPFAGRPISPAAPWRLRVQVSPRQLVLQMVYKPATGKAFAAAKVVLAGSEFSADLLHDAAYIRLAAALLLDSLPAARKLVPGVATPDAGGSLTIVGPVQAEVDEDTPAKVAWTLFSWRFAGDDGLWAPHVIGAAQSAAASGKQLWQLHIDPSRSGPNAPVIYAQVEKGPGGRAKELRAAMLRRQDMIRERDGAEARAQAYAELSDGVGTAAAFLLHNSLESSYLSLRLGRELVNPKTAVFPPGNIFGLLGEIRSGYLSGLRFYFDWAPKHGSSFNGEPTYLEWSRFVCGYSFELPLRGFITRLEAIPKIGLWTVNSRLAIVDDAGDTSYQNFTLDNAFSVGGEAAAVHDTGRYQLRLWYARDLPTLVANVNGIRRSVLGQRYGGDAMLRTSPADGRRAHWRVGYQLFVYYEDVVYRQRSTSQNSFSLDISTVYGGGGIALQW